MQATSSGVECTLDPELQVERYIFFPACGERFGRPGESLLEQETDEAPSDGLETIAQVPYQH